MKASSFLRFFLLTLLCLGNWLAANATHVTGGDLTYTYINGSASRYRVVTRLYLRDPSLGVPDQLNIQLNCALNGCSRQLLHSNRSYPAHAKEFWLRRRDL